MLELSVEQREALALAGRILGEEVRGTEILRPGTLRAEAASGRAVIVKRARCPPGLSFDLRDPKTSAPFLGDVAGLTFLGPRGPGLLGYDREAGVLVLPDLGRFPGLDEPLRRGTAAQAREALLAWAEALGRQHAAHAGQRAAYEAIREPLGPPRLPFPSSFVVELCAQLDSLGIPAPREALDKALAYEDTAFDTYVHRDACPDNVLLMPEGALLIDFERSVFGPATLDGTMLRMAMPTCWCAGRVPDEVLDAVEARWRSLASQGLPALRDDARHAAGRADGCAHHLAISLAWRLPEALREDPTWGIATIRPRLLTQLRQFEALEGWPELHEMSHALLRTLRARWGDTELALYPAFS